MSTDERNAINKEIGERIKAIRKQKGITLADLGARLGISESNMQRYESGKIASVSIDFINRLAPILEVNPEWLIGWDRMILHKVTTLILKQLNTLNTFAPVLLHVYYSPHHVEFQRRICKKLWNILNF